MARPNQQTLRQLLLDIGIYKQDAIHVVASGGGSVTTFLTSDLAGLTSDILRGSEFMPWTRPIGDSSSGVRVPAVITANSGIGLLTINNAIFNIPFAANDRAVIQNLNGQGYPQRRKEFALKMSCMEQYDPDATTVQAIVGPSVNDYWNNIPSTLRSVYRATAYDGEVEMEIAPATWQNLIDVAGHRINIPWDWATTDELRLYGRADTTAWWDSLIDALGVTNPTLTPYNTVVVGDPQKLILGCEPWLGNRSDDDTMRRIQFDYSRRLAQGPTRSYPNEVWLS